MAASFSDQFQLSQDPTFQHRVQAALLSSCVSIANEGWTVPFHRERASYAAQILGAAGSQGQYVTLFANTASTDTNCIADATQAGTVVLTPANAAAQAALVTDAHISAAISSEFNAFIRVPGN